MKRKPAPRRFWTPEEEAVLRRLYPDLPAWKVAVALGRTSCAVFQRARLLCQEAADLGHPRTTANAPARIRGLNRLALELLPELEDLSPEAAAQAHDEMDLLAKTLVLGGELIARRSA